MIDQLNLLDQIKPEPTLAESNALRDKAEGRAYLHASQRWIDAARMAVLWCSAKLGKFTTQDVWRYLDAAEKDPLETERNPKAIGPIMSQMRREGHIIPTGEFTPNTRRHSSPSRVWRGATPEEYRDAQEKK